MIGLSTMLDDMIDQECVWFKVVNDPASTTAKDIRNVYHPLYKCTQCDGLPMCCKGYRVIEYDKQIKYTGE